MVLPSNIPERNSTLSLSFRWETMCDWPGFLLSSYQAVAQNAHPQEYNNSYTINDYGSKNSFRMAPYHRFDIAIQFHKQKKKYERTFELGVYNAYNRKNPFYYTTVYDPNTQQTKLKQISLFPLIPSISWTWKF